MKTFFLVALVYSIMMLAASIFVTWRYLAEGKGFAFAGGVLYVAICVIAVAETVVLLGVLFK